jgi:YhcH/YjgK/YiaL family protein
MICDTIDNLRKYAGVDPRFNAIADFVERNDLAAIADGSYEVCDGVKANISTYEPGSGGDFEAHREYHDLQYAITGGEAIEVIPTRFGAESKGYTPDIEFFPVRKCECTSIALEAGYFAFLAPEDAHRPCIRLHDGKIKKAVFKIKI